jgi:hypothetical protein
LSAEGVSTNKGDKVRFHVSDIFLPNAGGVLIASPEESELEGTIVDFSDSGPNVRYFAVVEVVKTQSLIVPVERLDVVETSSPSRGKGTL